MSESPTPPPVAPDGSAVPDPRPLLPEGTSDDTAAGWGESGDGFDDGHYLDERPPHHDRE